MSNLIMYYVECGKDCKYFLRYKDVIKYLSSFNYLIDEICIGKMSLNYVSINNKLEF